MTLGNSKICSIKLETQESRYVVMSESKIPRTQGADDVSSDPKIIKLKPKSQLFSSDLKVGKKQNKKQRNKEQKTTFQHEAVRQEEIPFYLGKLNLFV